MNLLPLPEEPFISESERTPSVRASLVRFDICFHNFMECKKETQRLSKIIADLQGSPKKPYIRAGIQDRPKKMRKKRSKSTLDPKRSRLPIHKEEIIRVQEVPEDAVFKGYQDYLVQEIELSSKNILFKLERWRKADGSYISAVLPSEYKGSHFGPSLRAFIAYQYHYARVTQPRLLAQLMDFGIEISKAQLNEIILELATVAEEEMLDVLQTAISHSKYIQTDDTGARDQGKNRICTHVGNPFFTFLKTTDSKSRINFLEVLNTPGTYTINEIALNYVRQQGSKKLLKQVENIGSVRLQNQADFISYLDQHRIQGEVHQRIVTEAALIGSISTLVKEGFTIISDGAKQFNVMNHGACWVHAIRLLEEERSERSETQAKIDEVLSKVRFLYHHLKRYCNDPSPILKRRIEVYFDLICDLVTPSPAFNAALKRFQLNRLDLLRCLEKPEIPLHNNLSENDLREYVIRRKISGGTRSDRGRKARDAFCSLVKTCKKLKLSFWQWLTGRIHKNGRIPPLVEILKSKLLAF